MGAEGGCCSAMARLRIVSFPDHAKGLGTSPLELNIGNFAYPEPKLGFISAAACSPAHVSNNNLKLKDHIIYIQLQEFSAVPT